MIDLVIKTFGGDLDLTISEPTEGGVVDVCLATAGASLTVELGPKSVVRVIEELLHKVNDYDKAHGTDLLSQRV